MGLSDSSHRFTSVAAEKAHGVTYTPTKLADFVAAQILSAAHLSRRRGTIRILDPAVGEGQLLLSLTSKIKAESDLNIEIYGYDTDAIVLRKAEARLREIWPTTAIKFTHGSFLDVIAEGTGNAGQLSLFNCAPIEQFDLVIANPPYVRTQVMGASRARELAHKFGLNGRVDISYAFILGIGAILENDGVAGLIVSNRFMSTRSGESVRRSIMNQFSLVHVWDFGDTKLFDAAVLPAVLVMKPKAGDSGPPTFTSIYETNDSSLFKAESPIEAVEHQGIVEISDGRRFVVIKGSLGQRDDHGSI